MVGTYGRGIWILDDFAVLRQMTPAIAEEPVHLFKPDPTVRTRRNTSFDTPFPPEVPHALNPPEGVIIHYALASKPSGDIALDVLDSSGTLVRHMSSAPMVPVSEAAEPTNPNFWLAVPQPLPAVVGTNRMSWDLRYEAPPAFAHTFEINANPGLTPTSPEGALAPPGTYTIKLTVNGRSYTQMAKVTNDPRSPATAADVRAQHALLRDINAGIKTSWDGYQQVEAMRAVLKARMPADSTSELAKALKTFSAKVDTVGGTSGGGGGFGGFGGGRKPTPNFAALNGVLVAQHMAQENGDLAPTEAMLAGHASTCRDLKTVVTNWAAFNQKDVPEVNKVLTTHGLQPVAMAAGVATPTCGLPARQ